MEWNGRVFSMTVQKQSTCIKKKNELIEGTDEKTDGGLGGQKRLTREAMLSEKTDT